MKDVSGRQINHLIFLILLFVFAVTNAPQAFAGPNRTTYQAKIVKPDGYPLEASNVNFRFSILDPAGSCILYVESYNSVNMSSTGGLISFALGSGVKNFPVGAVTFEQVFSNITPFLACDSGGPATYSPSANDTRKIVMQFHDGTGWQTLPAMTINAVPYAMFANDSQTLNGMPASDFVQVSSLASCGAGEALTFTGLGGFSCLPAPSAVSGAAVISALGYTPVDAVSLTAVTSSVDSVSNTVASVSSTVAAVSSAVFSVSSTVTSLQNTVAASFAAITSSQWVTSGTSIHYITGNVGIGTSAPQAPLEISNSVTKKLILRDDQDGVSQSSIISFEGATDGAHGWVGFASTADDDLSILAQGATGDLVLGAGNAFAKGLRIKGTTGNIGVGLSAPVTRLDVNGGVRISMESATCAVSYAGTIRYNAGAVEFCNGTTWAAFGVSGAGLQSLNGSTSGTQNFAHGFTGTTPNFVTNNGVHTLNIPLASAGSVTAGLISNTDYVNFSNKITSSAASIAQVLGYTPASATALANYAVRANNLSDLTSSATARANLGLGGFATVSSLDLGSASATGILAEARLPSFAGVSSGTQYTKVTVDGKGRVTSGAQLSASDISTALGYAPAQGTSATQWTTSGSTIYYNTGNVGIGTSAPDTRFHINGGAYADAQMRIESNNSASTIGVDFWHGGGARKGFVGIRSSGSTAPTPAGQSLYLWSDNFGSPIIFGTQSVERIRIDSAGNMGIGTSAPVTRLDVTGAVRIGMDAATCNATFAGSIRYNAGSLQYCNGSAWSSLGVASAGVMAFNGSTSQTQSLANAITGTTPAFVTANGVHTLNIPLASTGAVTAGLISNTDYLNFSNKITSSAASIAQVLGYTPASATDLANYLVRSNNLSDLTSSATARANLGLGGFATVSSLDLGSASATGILAEARLPSFAGVTSGAQYTKVTVDGKGRVTSGAQLAASDISTALGFTPAQATSSTQWTTNGSRIYYNTGNVGIGVNSPSESLHVSGTVRANGLVNANNDTIEIHAGTSLSDTANAALEMNSLTAAVNPGVVHLTMGETVSSYIAFGKEVGGPVKTSYLYIQNNGDVGIGTTTPMTQLDVAGGIRVSMESATCATSFAGTIRYNAGSLQYCNGSAWTSLGVASSGVVSFNGSTSQTQTLANAITGTTPAFVTANGVHTLNIPLASTAAVTAGLISNTDYLNFSNKITSSAASIAQVLGYTPASATALANYLVRSNNLSDLTSPVTARANLGLGGFATVSSLDLGSASATGILAEARLPSFVGVTSGTQYTKVTVDGKGRVTSGAQLSASDISTALGYSPAQATSSTQWTTSGSTIHYTAGNVGIGTSAPGRQVTVAGSSYPLVSIQSSGSNGGVLELISNGDNITGKPIALFNQAGNFRLRPYDAADPAGITVLQTSGNVGIGTSAPASVLHLEKSDNIAVRVTRNNQLNALLGDLGSTNHGQLNLYNASGTIGVLLSSGQESYFTGGNVGIGTASPLTTLDVNGSLTAGGVVTEQFNLTVDGVSNTTYAIGSLTNNGKVTHVTFHMTVHNSSTIDALNFQVSLASYSNGTFYPNWLELPVGFGSTGWEGRKNYVIDVRRQGSGSGSTFNFRVRNKGGVGSSSTMTIRMTYNSDATFTRITHQNSVATTFNAGTAAAGGAVDGMYGGLEYSFPVAIAQSWRPSDNDGLFVKNSGNVGIGTSSPSEKLEVSGSVKAVAYLYTSDRRLKEEIITLPDALTKVMQLRGVNFVWRNTKEKTVGFIAQEVEAVYPELVKTDQHSGFKAVQYGNIVAILVEALKQEHKERVEAQMRCEADIKDVKRAVASVDEKASARMQQLEKENKDLKSRLERLEKLLLKQ